METIAIIYATREGQTRKIAEAMQAGFLRRGCQVQLVNAADTLAAAGLELAGFDKVVFGASLHAGSIEKELVRYMQIHRAELEQKRCWFFLVLMAAATPDLDQRRHDLADAEQRVNKQLPIGFTGIEMIAGALRYTRYNWFIKWVMKKISARQGGATDTSRDHEYTDWEQVQRYTDSIASA